MTAAEPKPPSLANAGAASWRAVLWLVGSRGGSVAFALRCRCLRAHSGPADGWCRGRGRRCRSRFQRFRCARRWRHQRFRPARQRQDSRSGQHGNGKTIQGSTTRHGSGQHGNGIRRHRQPQENEPGGTGSKDEKKDSGGQSTLQASLPPARKARVTSLAARTPRTRRTTRASSPRFPIRSPPVPDPVAAVPDRGGAGSRCGGAAVPDVVGAGSRCGGAGSRCGGAGSDWWRRLPMWSRRFPSGGAGSDAVAPVPIAVAPVPNLVAPVSEVIALIQDMLTSVAGAVVPLTQLQSALYSFLLGIAGVQPVVAGLGGVAGAGLSPAAGASVASQWPLVLPLAGIPGVPLAGNAATGVATLGGIAASTFGAMTQVGRASSLPGMAPPAPNGAFSMGVESFFRHGFGAVLLPVSLWALATGALPGAGGLVILTAAGVRVGYRQAKAGFALRIAGIAGFARPGAVPLGVVRSGSLVVIRPRALRVVRPGALSAGCLLDKVA